MAAPAILPATGPGPPGGDIARVRPPALAPGSRTRGPASLTA
ncbi:hypothetical protein [Amycolatopsis tolypomycina]|nr:hypothetical protein [Amycolatopsis tolypomycina]